MFSTGITSTLPARAVNRRTNKKRTATRDQQEEKDCGAQWRRNAFLRQPISARSPKTVVRSNFEQNYNYLTRANYLYLLRCVRSYARLLGKVHAHTPGDSIGAGICNLFYELEGMVGQEIAINIHTNGKRLEFVLWNTYDWGNYNVYWIPLRFVESLPTPLKRLTISFLHQFRKSMRLGTTNSADDLCWVLEWMLETADDYEDEKERRALIKHVGDYHKGGRIYKLMERIETKCYHRNLSSALDKYVPASGYEKEWISIMKEGLRFIGEGLPNIFQYAYDVFEDEDYDEIPLTLDQMIRFIYDADDMVTENLSRHIDETYNNVYAVGLCATLMLTPDNKELFGKEAFPEEFIGYLGMLNDFIREKKYEK